VIGDRDIVLRVDAVGGNVVSLLELHDDVLDARGVQAWAVTATDQDGWLLSELGDGLILDAGQAACRYTQLIDQLLAQEADRG
jgi:hypothetical protein